MAVNQIQGILLSESDPVSQVEDIQIQGILQTESGIGYPRVNAREFPVVYQRKDILQSQPEAEITGLIY